MVTSILLRRWWWLPIMIRLLGRRRAERGLAVALLTERS
jgi:hypothetical protein